MKFIIIALLSAMPRGDDLSTLAKASKEDLHVLSNMLGINQKLEFQKKSLVENIVEHARSSWTDECRKHKCNVAVTHMVQKGAYPLKVNLVDALESDTIELVMKKIKKQLGWDANKPIKLDVNIGLHAQRTLNGDEVIMDTIGPHKPPLVPLDRCETRTLYVKMYELDIAAPVTPESMLKDKDTMKKRAHEDSDSCERKERKSE